MWLVVESAEVVICRLPPLKAMLDVVSVPCVEVNPVLAMPPAVPGKLASALATSPAVGWAAVVSGAALVSRNMWSWCPSS